MRYLRYWGILSGTLGLLLTASIIAAGAQAWPQRPVTVIVPFTAGGNTDGIARMTGQRLGEAFGKPLIIENRPGAAGALAAEAAAKSQPDGYTLFVAALPVLAVVPAISKVHFDPQKDFAPISIVRYCRRTYFGDVLKSF
jgi:tripartite-type tricarboxylate transporter receptor subunit TctC